MFGKCYYVFMLQEELKKIFKELFSPKAVFRKVLGRAFDEISVKLTKEQRNTIEKHVLECGDGKIFLEFSDDQLRSAGVGSEEELEPLIEKVFSNFGAETQKYHDELMTKIPLILEKTSNDAVRDILKIINTTAKKNLIDDRLEFDNYKKKIESIWGKSIDRLEVFIALAFEIGDYVNDTYRPEAALNNDIVFDVLARLHARACQISNEILVLIKNGFADGASARWRSLHEVNVIANFIKDNGNELAERYWLHDNIESFNAAKQYREYTDRLQLSVLSDEDYENIQERKDELIARFGQNYKNSYGWASAVLANPNPTFADIEKRVNLNHLRPYYRLASHSVHANPKGIFFKLGLLENSQILLTGSSHLGLCDPGQLTAISLANISVALLAHKPTIDTNIFARTMLRFSNEVTESFIKAHDRSIIKTESIDEQA